MANKYHVLQSRFTHERWAQMRKAADRRGISVNALINLCLTPMLEREEKENPEFPMLAGDTEILGQAGDDTQNNLF